MDPEAQTDPVLCAAMLDDLQMVAVSDITDVDASLDSFGICSKGELDGCSCAVNITHFSTYTVIDSSIAYEAPAEPAENTSAEPAESTSAQTGAIAGGSQRPFTHKVEMEVKLPLSKAEFSAEKQDLFKKAVAEAAGNGVTASDVSLANIADARRSGSVKFDVTVKTTSESLATAVAGERDSLVACVRCVPVRDSDRVHAKPPLFRESLSMNAHEPHGGGGGGRRTHSYKAQRKARGQWPAGRHYHKASHRVQCRLCPERGWRRGSVDDKVGSRSPDRHARCSLGRGERVLDNSATQRHVSKSWESVCLCERGGWVWLRGGEG